MKIREPIYHSLVITPMMEGVCTPETSVYSNDTTRHYIPEGSNLHRSVVEHKEIFYYKPFHVHY
jgi:hypothetical protein